MKRLFGIMATFICTLGFASVVNADPGTITAGTELGADAVTVETESYDAENHLTTIKVTLNATNSSIDKILNQTPGNGASEGVFYIGLTPEKYSQYATNHTAFKKTNTYASKGSSLSDVVTFDQDGNVNACAQDVDAQGYATACSRFISMLKKETNTAQPTTWALAGLVTYKKDGKFVHDSSVSQGGVSTRNYLLDANRLNGATLQYGINYRIEMYNSFDWYMMYYVGGDVQDGTISPITEYEIIKVTYDIKYPISATINGVYSTQADYLDIATALSSESNDIIINKDLTIDDDVTIPANKKVTISNNVTVTVSDSKTLTVEGTLVNNGTVTNNGTINNQGTITNNGTISPITNIKANLVELNNAITEYNQLKANNFNESIYVEDVLNSLKNAYHAAESASTANYTFDKQNEIDSITQTLENAIASIKLDSAIKNYDYNNFNLVISNAKTEVIKTIYTSETVNALQALLDNEDNYRSKKVTDADIIEAYINEVQQAVNALVEKDADYSKVDAALDKISKLNLAIYTEKSRTSLSEAKDGVIRGKKISEQADVNAMATALENAIKGLQKLADYTAVDQALKRNPKTSEELKNYTPESIIEYKKLFSAINVDRDLPITQQAIVVGYADAINDAIDALVELPANYKVVNDAISRIPTDLTIYTESSVSALNDALSAVVKGLTITQQDIVDGFADAINDAVDNLIKIPTILADEVDTDKEVEDVILGVTDKDTTNKILLDSIANSKYKDIDNISVEVEISLGEDLEVDDTVFNEITDNFNKKFKNAKIVKFFDVTLNVVDTNRDKTIGQLTDLTEPLSLTIALPKEYRLVKKGYTRKYYVIRYHDGKVDILPASLTDGGKALIFESDKFSIYALAYVDVPSDGVEVKPPYTDASISSSVVLLGISLIGFASLIWIHSKKRES